MIRAKHTLFKKRRKGKLYFGFEVIFLFNFFIKFSEYGDYEFFLPKSIKKNDKIQTIQPTDRKNQVFGRVILPFGMNN
jgi:hypothetical protein